MRVLTLVTLVTLDCRPFDIATSVSEAAAAVYSPTVLRLRGQPRRFVSYWVVRLETHDPFIVLDDRAAHTISDSHRLMGPPI